MPKKFLTLLDTNRVPKRLTKPTLRNFLRKPDNSKEEDQEEKMRREVKVRKNSEMKETNLTRRRSIMIELSLRSREVISERDKRSRGRERI